MMRMRSAWTAVALAGAIGIASQSHAAGVFQEQNGLVVCEIESEPLAGDWQKFTIEKCAGVAASRSVETARKCHSNPFWQDMAEKAFTRAITPAVHKFAAHFLDPPPASEKKTVLQHYRLDSKLPPGRYWDKRLDQDAPPFPEELKVIPGP